MYSSSDNCNYSSNTSKDICDVCEQRPIPPCNHRRSRHDRYDPGVSYFTSVITPVTNLTPQYSGCTGCVEFRMRRKNKVVSLQWEPFNGTMAASGVSYLSVAQSICNTPPYQIR
jgi:hypothetical protein